MWTVVRMLPRMCGSQGNFGGSQFFIYTIWVPEIKLRSSGMEADTFTH